MIKLDAAVKSMGLTFFVEHYWLLRDTALSDDCLARMLPYENAELETRLARVRNGRRIIRERLHCQVLDRAARSNRIEQETRRLAASILETDCK